MGLLQFPPMLTSEPLRLRLDSALQRDLEARLRAWQERDGTRRLLARDASLFSDSDEDRWMGWLEPSATVEGLDPLLGELASGALHDTATVFLLGMGGSSLGSEVVYRTLHDRVERRLVVLDTTNPDAVGSVLDTAEPASCLVIAASKSGSTLETAVLLDLFWERFERALGDRAGARFAAITDPGSQLEALARQRRFGHVFLGDPEIGGRFSVLSPFGVVPAATLGLDVELLVEGARAVASEVAAASGPGLAGTPVGLGLALAAAHASGRNKVTLKTSPSLQSFGTWLEQLLAESTGKHGVGLVPVDGEPEWPLAQLGGDRMLVTLRVEGETVEGCEGWENVPDLAGAELCLPDVQALGGAFYGWQIATAVVGAELGLNPFDQPDVESAKVATRRIVEAQPRQPEPAATAGGEALLVEGADASSALAELFAAAPDAGQYFAVLAYLPMAPHVQDALSAVRRSVLEHRGWATCLGFGPRYLHSTGQAHKGGPPQGRFLLLTTPSSDRRLVPGRGLSLAALHHAQAMGDLEVLRERGRPVVHAELHGPLEEALAELAGAVDAALRAAT